jgi:uncharacterized phage protein gp47/JayE
MPFSRPSPQAIRDRLAAEVEAALPGADARARRSLEEVLVRMMAIASHEMHGHLAWAAKQILPDSAEAELLDRHAGIWGITRSQAAAARGAVTITGTAGAVLPAGAEMRRADDVRYLTDADATIGVGGTVAAAVTAVVAAAAGNAAATTALTLIAPAADIASAVVVGVAGLAAGADTEADAALRARLLARIQAPPAGGAAADYRAWALAVPGVERAWVYPRYLGAGTVGVAFLGLRGAIPAAPLVASVQAAIDALRPVTADVTVFAPTALPVAISIEIDPDSSATRAAVSAALAAFFLAEAEPGGTLRLSRLSAAVSAATGETWHRVTVPAADVVLAAGQVATLGTVTWL